MAPVSAQPGLAASLRRHFGTDSQTADPPIIDNLRCRTPGYDQPDAMPLAPVPPPRRGSNAAPPPVHSGLAHRIKVEARRDGTFTVTNSRNGFSKSYAASE